MEKTISLVSYLWLSSIFNYFNISFEAVIIYFCLLALDFLLWIAESKVNNIGITSAKAEKWVLKKVTLFCVPFIFVIVLKGAGMMEAASVSSSVILGILITSEWYSVLSHIYNINTGKTLPEIDALTYVVAKIKDIFTSNLKP